jgi:hypothetical protein
MHARTPSIKQSKKRRRFQPAKFSVQGAVSGCCANANESDLGFEAGPGAVVVIVLILKVL